MYSDNIHTIAVIGISEDQNKPSFQVASYLVQQGFTVIPVNPKFSQWYGLQSYPSLESIPPGIHVDMAYIFRRPHHVVQHIHDVLKRNDIHTIWLPEGISSNEGKILTENAGRRIIMNACFMKQHQTSKQVLNQDSQK